MGPAGFRLSAIPLNLAFPGVNGIFPVSVDVAHYGELPHSSPRRTGFFGHIIFSSPYITECTTEHKAIFEARSSRLFFLWSPNISS
jgi:hypothetical protein